MTWQHFKQAYLIKFWSPVPAVIAAGILNLLFWYYRHILGRHRRIYALGRAAITAGWRSQ